MASFLSSFYHFTRPHTVPATMLAIIYQFASAGGFSVGVPTTAFQVLAASLLKWELVVLFIVGINQIYDVEIDRINKQYLPLASGGFSMATAHVITYGSLVGSLALAVYQQDPVSLGLVIVCLAIGAAYSIPQLRFKQNKALAGISIVLARGLLVNLAEYAIFQRAVRGEGSVSTTLVTLETHSVDILMCVAHATLFTAAVAIAKDLPDMEGDRKFKIQTFALTHGWRVVGTIAVALIALGIVTPMTLALNYKSQLSANVRSAYITGAGVVILELARRLATLKAPDSNALSKWYHGTIWPVFYANFIVITLLQINASAQTQL